MCIGLIVEIDLLAVGAAYLDLGDLPQVVWMNLSHGFVKLLARCIRTSILGEQPIPNAPFTSMLKTLAATTGVEYYVIAQATNIL